MSIHIQSNDVSTALLTWYDANKADLPWRGADAYRVWLSEIMLQQTQIDTVIPYYNRFLESYPSIVALAAADLDQVLKMWEGLGYYSRARNLHKTAKIITNDFNGAFPSTVPDLLKLPGIGQYTAGAIASIAFGAQAALLDGNVIRVFSRWLDLADDVTQSKTKSMLWDVADELVPPQRAGDYNQALMELGQKICTPKNPDCSQCPVQPICLAYANDTQAQRPVKKKKAKAPHYDVSAGIIRNEQGQFLIAQRPVDGLLGGLWEFPGGKQESDETMIACLQRELREELAIEVDVGALFIKVKHAFTHFKITLHAYECTYLGSSDGSDAPQAIQAADWAWVTQDQLHDYSFGKADREVIRALDERKNMLL